MCAMQCDHATYTVPTDHHSGLCIGSIACLAQQKTARLGNALGMVGVGTGIVTALGSLSASPALYAQMLGTMDDIEALCHHGEMCIILLM